MNQQILFNFSLSLSTVGAIILLKGQFLLGLFTLIISLGVSLFWLMSGFFEKFEYKFLDSKIEDDKDEEGKGVLKPF
tara:strand:- start:97 stop:327 length:231 start_codon:yes stop_codon:yes gene_type:complete